MVTNHLLLLGTVGWLTVMLTFITCYTLRADRLTLHDFDEAFTPLTEHETVYPPSAIYPHNEFVQLMTTPFISEQPTALQLAA